MSIYIPLLDNIIIYLKTRFLNEKYQAVSSLTMLLPCVIIKSDNNDINKLLNVIKNNYTFEDNNEVDQMELKTEIELWQIKWIKIKKEGMFKFNKII